MQSLLINAALLVLSAPFALVVAAVRLSRQLQLARLASQESFICSTCSNEVSLLGFWRCTCGHTYQGHLLRECPVCSSIPKMARCFECSATRMLW